MAGPQPSFAAAWLEQRRAGAAAVAAVEAAELRAMTPDQSLRFADALLAAAPLAVTRASCGFVEQQRLFARSRR